MKFFFSNYNTPHSKERYYNRQANTLVAGFKKINTLEMLQTAFKSNLFLFRVYN